MRCICKVGACILRVKFLENCLKSDIIPKFLKFRVPNNGCFDDESVHDFQRRLLRKEIVSAKNDHGQNLMKLYEKRALMCDSVQDNLLPSLVLYTRYERISFCKKQASVHSNKLRNLSLEQDRPLLNVSKTVITYGLNYDLPKYVMDAFLIR